MSDMAIGKVTANGWSAPRALLLIVGGQILLWTLLPALTFVTAPLDVIENIAWGEQWQLGYYKHPPLQAWLTGLLYQPTGAVWPIYMLSQLSIAVCFLSIWALGRDVLDERGRLLAVAFFSLIYYANIPTPEFNANVLQMPIWAVAPLLLWRAINSARIGWWLALGTVMALSVYSKYSAVVLVPVLAVAALSVPQGRAALLTPGPYIGAALAAVLVAPQMWWLVQHDYIPFAWAQGRSEHLAGLARLTGTAKFLGAQIADHGAALLVIAAGAVGRIGGRAQARQSLSHADRYVLVSAFAPITIATVSSIVLGTGIRDMWATPFFAYTGLAAAIWLRPHFELLRWRTMMAIWAALFVLAPVGVALAPVVGPTFRAKPARVAMDGVELAQQAEKLWREKTGRRLAIVAGPTWEAGVVASYAPGRPAFFVDGEMPKNPWITPEKLGTEGALVLWPGSADSRPPASLGMLAPFAERGTFSVPYRYSDRRASIVWAIVPPKGDAKGGVQ